jgi:hypothetical protein
LVGDLFPNQAFTFQSEANLFYLKGDYRPDVNKAIEISNKIFHPGHIAFALFDYSEAIRGSRAASD